MNKTASKLFRAICGMVVMLVLVASITPMPVLAASNGIYIATATPHYKHPETGVIEDSGGSSSSVLGQSMTESATYEQALVEVDPEGNTYITVRLQLMDNIKDPQFQVDGEPVTASLMQENYGDLSEDNTADFRMKVNSEDSIIRCNMYVIAMGREVIFYITVSDLQPGSGDFVTSVEVLETEAGSETEVTDEPASEEEITEESEEVSSTEPVQDDGKEEEQQSGLLEYDAQGNLVTDNESTAEEDKVDGSLIAPVLLGVAAVCVIAFCVWYFCFFKKKK